ncbi:MAG: 3-methyl-2-oxobutanoate hydroxymethyltransferase [bacterium]
MDKKKVTVPSLKEMKQRVEKIVALTAYDYLFASILDEVGVDIILVGDSGAMVFAGYETTLPITMDEMIYHVKAVSQGTQRALLVADMPFLSFQITPEEAIKNAGRFLKEANAEAVKIEGGQPIADTVLKMVQVGIPVMGHLGLTPQSIHGFGGYKVQATNRTDAQKLLEDAVILEQAGVFAIVLEKIPAELAKEVTEKVSVPTIGIGAGKYCDGQVLVTHDMLGLFEKFRPKFVRRYAELGTEIRKTCRQFKNDVKEGKFPNADESY